MTTRRTILRSALLAGAAASPLAHAALRLPAAHAQGAAPGTAPDPVNDLLEAFVPGYDRPGVPRGLQLSHAGDDLSRRAVTWLTSDTAPGTIVQWGVVGVDADPRDVRPRHLTAEQRGTSEPAPFGDGDLEDLLAGHRSPGPDVHHGERQVHVHRATISGLQPGQRIAYRVGDGTRWSPTQLTSGGAVADEGFRFVHFGDHGTKRSSRRTTRAVAARRPDWALLAGDLSYANGDQRLWDVWAEQAMPLGARVPMMLAPGNHEAKDFNGQTYRTRFTMPRRGTPFYRWIHGNVCVISTAAGAFFGDVEGAVEDIANELLWTEQALAEAAALRAAGAIDFIVVVQHFPSFTHEDTRGPVSADRVIAAEQQLQRYQVDLLLVGHDHMYQRSYPMAFGVPTSGLLHGLGLVEGQPERFANHLGYVEVIAGAGGNGMYEFTEVDTLTLDPNSPQYGEGDPYLQRRLPWLAASRRECSFAEYVVEGPEIHVTAYGWDDGYHANEGNGIADDAVPFDGDDPRFDRDVEPQPIDRFTLVRKAYAAEVPTTPRPAAEVLADVPEAHGRLVYDEAEDCTRHDH